MESKYASSPTQTIQSLRSLYQRAARLFLQRNAVQTQSLIDRAFEIIHPPPTAGQDGLASQRKKWDILRITLETTLYTSPGLLPDEPSPSPITHGITPSTSGQAQLRSNLLLSPPSLLATMHTRSLRLFTPPSQKPSPAFLPPQILVSLVLAALKLDCPQVGRGMVEEWLARRSVETDTPMSANSMPESSKDEGYAKVLDVYCLHVLPRLGEWEYANEFLRYEMELPVSFKEQISTSLKTLHSQSLLPSSPPPPYVTKLPDAGIMSSSAESTPRPLSRVSSSSSISSTSTHTAVPATPRPLKPNRKALSPLPNGSGKKPKTRSRSRSTVRPSHHVNGTNKPSKQDLPQPSTSANGHPPSPTPTKDIIAPAASIHNIAHSFTSRFTSLHTALLYQLRSRLPFLVCVILPFLALITKVKMQRAVVPRRGGQADEARRRLGMDQTSLWSTAWKAIADTIYMAGRGLV